MRNKRNILLLFLTLIFVSSLYFFFKKELPLIKSGIKDTLVKQIEEALPFKAEILDISFHLFPLGISLNDLKLKNLHDKSHDAIPELFINRFSLGFSYQELLKGRIGLSTVTLDGSQLAISLDSIKKNKEPINFYFPTLFKITEYFNSTTVTLSNTSILGSWSEKKISFELKKGEAEIKSKKNKISFEFSLPSQIKTPLLNISPLFFLKGELTPQGLELEDLDIQNHGLNINASVKTKKLDTLITSPEFSVAGRLIFESDKLIDDLIFSLGYPKGKIKFDFSLNWEKGYLASGGMNLQTHNLEFKNYYIGDVVTTIEVFKSSLKVHELNILNPGLELRTQDFEIKKENGSFKNLSSDFNFNILRFELKPFLESLNLYQFPVNLVAQGPSSCKGTLVPNFQLTCQAELAGKNLDVKVKSQSPNSIVKLDEFSASGPVQISLNQVSYTAQIQTLGGKGTSEGKIEYNKGFHIKYEGAQLPLEKISPLAGLNFSGLTDVKGFIQGNSKTALFEMDLNSQNFTFENLDFGAVQTHLNYSKGNLSFENIKSALDSTELSGSLIIDLNKGWLDIETSSVNTDGQALQKIFNYYLPNQLLSQGQGAISLKINGPYDWRQWNSELSLNMNKILIANEFFDDIQFKSKILNNQLKVEKGLATKGPHKIQISGNGDLKNDSTVIAEFSQIPLEYIDNISLLGANIGGFMNFKSVLKNPLGSIEWVNNINIKEINMDDTELPELSLLSEYNKDEFTFILGYGNNALQFQTLWPLNSKKTGEISLVANQLDTRPLFSLIGSSSIMDEYQSSLSGEFYYKFPYQSFFKGDGNVKITEFFAERLGSGLTLSSPQKTEISNGYLSPITFFLKGPAQQNVQIEAEGNLEKDFNLKLKPEMEIQLLQPFFPFFDDLRGYLSGSIKISSLLSQPFIDGFLKINQGHIQIKNLNQTLSKVKIDTEFFDKKVNIKLIEGELGQGKITGEGTIDFIGYKNIKLQIPFEVKQSMIEPQDGIRFKTNAKGEISGHWFPYTIRGDIQIFEGLISKDFESSEHSLNRRSSLLPKIILQAASEPFVLDLNIEIPNTLNIRNNLIEGQIAGQLDVDGFISQPVIQGQIRLSENSKILFREHEFRVEQGLIRLNGTQDLNPSLLISAQSRIDKYDVTLNIQGSTTHPLIRLSSQPSLPEQDLVSLLALGQISTEIERQIQTPSSQSQAETQIGSVLLQNIPLFKKAQKAVGVNVQISSSFDPTLNAEFKKVTVSKKINNKTKVLASTGDFGFRELKLEYSLSDHLSAIGRFKQQDFLNNSLSIERQKTSESILGLDLEFRKEFR